MATSAPIPDGYAEAFSNQQASLSASMYIGLVTLTSFDTINYASLCDQTSGYVAFNIHIERDPSLDVNAQDCPNPASTTNYKCMLWGAPVSVQETTNTGQWRDSFHAVITASNGYNKNAPPASIPGFAGFVELGGAINAPLGANGFSTSVGSDYYPFSQAQEYSPSTYANACLALAPPKTCTFFNAFVVSDSGVPQGMYCSLYNATWSPSYATNHGQTTGSDRYSVSQSYGYSAQTNLIRDPDFDDTGGYPDLGPWYAWVFLQGGEMGGTATFVPGLTSVTLTQKPIAITTGQEYQLQYVYTASVGQASTCSLGAYIGGGSAGPSGVSLASSAGWTLASSTFTASSGGTQNLTFDMDCYGQDYSEISVSQVLLAAI